MDNYDQNNYVKPKHHIARWIVISLLLAGILFVSIFLLVNDEDTNPLESGSTEEIGDINNDSTVTNSETESTETSDVNNESEPEHLLLLPLMDEES